MQLNRTFSSIFCISSLSVLLVNCSKHDNGTTTVTKTWTVSTLAGNGNNAYTDGPDSSASFTNSSYIIADAPGNNIYISDQSSQVIRKISGGQVTTIAGVATGNNNPAFSNPYGIAIDNQNNIYDCENGDLIRKISTDGTSIKFGGTGAVSGQPGYTDGPDTLATLGSVLKIISGTDGNFYFADYDNVPNFQIRKLVPGGNISTLPQHDNTGIYYYNSTASAASGFDLSPSITRDKNGNFYFTANSNTLIKKMDASGNVTVFAGTVTPGYVDGKATVAQFSHITSLVAGADGHLYVADFANNAIREVQPDGTVSTIAGKSGQGFQDGDAATAKFFRPFDIAIDGNGFLYVSDIQNFRVRKITFK